MGLTLSTFTDVQKEIYESGLIQQAYVEGADGMAEIAKGRAMRFTPGLRDVVFPMILGAAGSFLNTGETGCFPGYDSTYTDETVTTSMYDKASVKMTYAYGVVQVTTAALEMAHRLPGSDMRALLDPFIMDIEGIAKAAGERFANTMISGHKGYLFRLAETSACGTGSLNDDSHYEYTITIDQNSDGTEYNYMTNCHAVVPNTLVEIVVISGDTLVAASSHYIQGRVKSILSDTQFKLELYGTRTISDTSALTNTHAVRMQRRTGVYEPYGLGDMIGNVDTDYDGAGDNDFPRLSTETKIDPDTVGQWQSQIIDGASWGTDINGAFDQAMDDLYNKGGHKPAPGDTTILTTSTLVRRMIRGTDAMVRYTPSEERDLRKMGDKLTYNNATLQMSRKMPVGVAYIISNNDIAMDDISARGPFWHKDPNIPGAGGGGLSVQTDTNTPRHRAIMCLYMQRYPLRRMTHARITGLPRTLA